MFQRCVETTFDPRMGEVKVLRVLELNMVDHPFKPRENLDVAIAVTW